MERALRRPEPHRVLKRGSIWWAGLGTRRLVLLVQADAFNRSRIATVMAVPLTGDTRLVLAL